MKRKPKIKNWLKLFFLWIPFTIFLIWASYHQFYKTYPIISEPIDESQYVYITDVNTGAPIVKSSIEMPIKSADQVQAKTFFSIVTGENNIEESEKEQLSGEEIKALEQKKTYLEQEIKILERNKEHLEENISKLKEQNQKFSKISYAMQEAMIKFIERNRVRDMFAGAFIGAFVSVVLAFILSRPTIVRKIDNYLFYLTNKH